MPETWTFNAQGDVPPEAHDDIDLQAGIADDRALATTNVEAVAAELPNETALEGFSSVDVQIEGDDLDSPLILARLHWPSQPRDELADTARALAVQLDMDPSKIDIWEAQRRDNGSLVNGLDAIDDTMGFRQLTLDYKDVGSDRAVAMVTLFWDHEAPDPEVPLVDSPLKADRRTISAQGATTSHPCNPDHRESTIEVSPTPTVRTASAFFATPLAMGPSRPVPDSLQRGQRRPLVRDVVRVDVSSPDVDD